LSPEIISTVTINEKNIIKTTVKDRILLRRYICRPERDLILLLNILL